MRQSTLFTKTRKEAPKDEVAKNAQLLIRAGYVHKEMAGAYSFLPLGLRVLKKIEQIIREEMDAIGGQEVSLTALQEKSLWSKTGRWNDKVVDNWFKTKLKGGAELGLATTHEEPLVSIMKEHVSSYRDLPRYVYQFQVKFRNELRAKSGLFRGREFLMKDLYSFSRDKKEHEEFYGRAKVAYTKIFDRVGIGDKTYYTLASGASFSEYSHEFQTLTDAGEDTINLCSKCSVAVNEEIIREQKVCPQCKGSDFKKEKSVEVGNIFPLGTKFSEAMGLTYRDKDGVEIPVIMGSYGIGLGRLMGTVVEVLADKSGIVWPRSIAPFSVHLICLTCEEGKNVHTFAEELYMTLQKDGVEVLYDERDSSAGEKLADADLLGTPVRVVVSEKTVAKKSVEVKERSGGEARLMKREEFLRYLRE